MWRQIVNCTILLRSLVWHHNVVDGLQYSSNIISLNIYSSCTQWHRSVLFSRFSVLCILFTWGLIVMHHVDVSFRDSMIREGHLDRILTALQMKVILPFICGSWHLYRKAMQWLSGGAAGCFRKSVAAINLYLLVLHSSHSQTQRLKGKMIEILSKELKMGYFNWVCERFEHFAMLLLTLASLWEEIFARKDVLKSNSSW